MQRAKQSPEAIQFDAASGVHAVCLGSTRYEIKEQASGGHNCLEFVRANSNGVQKTYFPRALVLAFAARHRADRNAKVLAG